MPDWYVLVFLIVRILKFFIVNFKEAFDIFNTSSGHLSYSALATIQMMHRIGGLITAVYIAILAISLFVSKIVQYYTSLELLC